MTLPRRPTAGAGTRSVETSVRHDPSAPEAAPTATTENSAAEPLAYTLEQAAALLQISPDTYYRRVRLGLLPGRKLGGQWRVPRAALHRYVEGLAQAEQEAAS